jgi:hypothetical protein
MKDDIEHECHQKSDRNSGQGALPTCDEQIG